MEEVEKTIVKETKGRIWSEEEVEQAVNDLGNQSLTQLLQFAKAESTNGKYVPTYRRLGPTFMFYLEGRDENVGLHKRVVYSYLREWDSFTLYMNSAASLLSDDVYKQFEAMLAEIFGDDKFGGKIVTIPIEDVAPKTDAFLDAMRWLKNQVSD
jgi:hypothetical protein